MFAARQPILFHRPSVSLFNRAAGCHAEARLQVQSHIHTHPRPVCGGVGVGVSRKIANRPNPRDQKEKDPQMLGGPGERV